MRTYSVQKGRRGVTPEVSGPVIPQSPQTPHKRYVFAQGTSDIVVKLTGVTGITNIAEDGVTDHFFIV